MLARGTTMLGEAMRYGTILSRHGTLLPVVGSKFPLLDVTKHEGHRRVILTSIIAFPNCIRLVRPRIEWSDTRITVEWCCCLPVASLDMILIWLDGTPGIFYERKRNDLHFRSFTIRNSDNFRCVAVLTSESATKYGVNKSSSVMNGNSNN